MTFDRLSPDLKALINFRSSKHQNDNKSISNNKLVKDFSSRHQNLAYNNWNQKFRKIRKEIYKQFSHKCCNKEFCWLISELIINFKLPSNKICFSSHFINMYIKSIVCILPGVRTIIFDTELPISPFFFNIPFSYCL